MLTLGPSTLDHPLANGCPPNWVSAWGDDDHGPWVEIHTGDARQSLRWIPPGTFRMGSFETRGAWLLSESPQHPVTISRGFWLFDTPCTQALWVAVMGENPSHFQGAKRPVENVSWDDCQRFLQQLNDRLPGVNLNLPTEAQWEYACRAGTQTATYAGDLASSDDGRASGLDEIAWYKVNSEEQTHDVAEKQSNAWGLYDMLGNVWEWCRDGESRYKDEHATDPEHGAGSPSADRVIRGGSWAASAQGVRAAYRIADHPGGRGRSLGFRCSSSGEPGGRPGRGEEPQRSVEAEAEPA